MKKQFHLRQLPLTTKCPTYCKPSTVPNFTNLILLLKQTQNLLPNLPPHVTKPSLISQQRSTLKMLSSNPNLVMKPFDGLMDTLVYISTIKEHLADSSTYKELNFDPTQAVRNEALSTLDYLYNTHQVGDITRHHLTPPNRTPTQPFYSLPKVYKPKIPLRTKVSTCDSPTNQLPNYVTHFIQPLVQMLPSYI